jgi:hypothetical protein
MDNNKLLRELIRFYYDFDAFQSCYLSEGKIAGIYQILIDRNRIVYVENDGILLGYGESLRISYDIFGRIICGLNVYEHLHEIDIENGPIAYVANVTISPLHRKSNVIKELTKQFFTINKGATHYCGQALRKRHQPVKVFDFHESYLKWVKE